MSTPAFIPQDASAIPVVRFYTQFDPYYYSTDNRPLQDLDTNVRLTAGQGGDSARRAVILTELALGEVFRQLFSTSNSSGYVAGLGITNPTGITITVQPGSWYQISSINDSISTQVLKQSLLLAPVTLPILAPTVSGQSINYLVQIASSSLTSTNMLTSALPLLDSTNPMLPGLLINGELLVGIKSGISATTGSQVTPTADSGYSPLYVVTSTYGAVTPTVQVSTVGSTPSVPGMTHSPVIQYPVTGAASVASIGGLPVASLPQGAVSSVVISTNTQGKQINPFSPIKVSLLVSTPSISGVPQLQFSYLSIAEGGSTAATAVTLTAETFGVPGMANTLLTHTMSATIPASAFASFASTFWKVTADKLNIVITRNGTAGADTLANPLYIHDVILSQ